MGKIWDNLKQNKVVIGGVTHYGASGVLMNRLVTAFPLIMVNIVAFSGQYAWAHEHLKTWHTTGQFAFALALESVAVFLAYQAYMAEKRNDSALRLKIASYAFALLVAAINYSHFTNGHWNQPTAVGIVVGMMSAISPWLWSTYSRSVSRTILFTRGLIEEHALRLGATRWLWHPIASFKVMRMATWTGNNKPSKAIMEWEDSEREKAQEKVRKSIESKAAMNGKSHSDEIEKII